MNIVVCLKQVPAATDVKIDPQTKTLVRQGIKNIINPFDTYALEEGIRIRERCGGKVTALSMGPPQAEEALREAISVGADEGVLLSDAAFAGADTLATAYTLAAAIQKLGQYDLIICGRQTIDGDTGQVGPELVEILGIPFIAYVSQIEEVTGGEIRARRVAENGYETIEARLPALITVVKEINVPRLPSLRGIARSKSAVIPVWTIRELGVDRGSVGVSGSATKIIDVFLPRRTFQGEIFQGELGSQVESLVDKLKDAGLV